MQEILSRLNNLSLQDSEEELVELLTELKATVVRNPDLSKNVLNANFINSANDWMENDSLRPLCLDVLEICLINYKIVDSDSFKVVELLLNSNYLAGIAIRKLQHSCTEISSLIPKTIILLLIKCLNSQHVNIGPPSVEILIEFLSNDSFLNDADIQFQLSTTAESSNSEVLCRVYEVCVGIGTKKHLAFQKFLPIIEKGLNELTTGSDVLYQLNLLDIFQALCFKDYGLQYLESKDFLKNLAKKIEEVNEDPLGALLLPGLMKLFGSLSAAYPQKIFQSYSSLFDMLFNCLLGEHSPIIYSALDTLGYLCRSNECKKSLDKDFGDKVSNTLSHIYSNISSYPSDTKLRAFNCLENAFSVDDPELVNNQITCICEKWCNNIFGPNVDLSSLLSYCKTPFEDLSQSSFGFLKALAVHSFGQKGIAHSAGFIEFLLDRKIGTTFELKQRKFEIIEILSKSTIFDAPTIAKFCKYVREGPNFVEPVSEVSFEPS